MPEYLAPGVYIEETSFRAKSIEGVSTSTAGFVGATRFGPISGPPELLTSFADFQRIYGGMEDLSFGTNFLAHAVRAFFEEGGKRLFVMRVFGQGTTPLAFTNGIPTNYYGVAARRDDMDADFAALRVVARFPGAAGNFRIILTPVVGDNVLRQNPDPATPGSFLPTLTRVSEFDVVHMRSPSGATPPFAHEGGGNGLRVVMRNPANGQYRLVNPGAGAEIVVDAATFPSNTTIQVRQLRLRVEIAHQLPDQNVFGAPQLIGEYSFDPRSLAALTDTFTRIPETRLAALTIPFAFEGFTEGTDDTTRATNTLALVADLLSGNSIASLLDNRPLVASTITLSGGTDGVAPVAAEYEGTAVGFNDYLNNPLDEEKNGLLAFEGVEDISIVAAPGYSALTDATTRFSVQNAIINHCERMRYRVAVLDTPRNQLPTEALAYRNQRSSTHAALYYPWITIADPNRPGRRLALPPSGFVAGIYARNDVEHAVFKAPANEVVRMAVDFEQRINKAQQELLNPNGVNCFRFFEGRGYLVWGARTISDDPEWKYISVRRYFAYLERSIERGTQWAVFENNGPQLWANVRRTIEDFLFNEWKQGGLLGTKPEEAFFVRCDLSTMTQNDLDNGRLICLIGVAVVRPAEFVIFRIGQWTASTPV